MTKLYINLNKFIESLPDIQDKPMKEKEEVKEEQESEVYNDNLDDDGLEEIELIEENTLSTKGTYFIHPHRYNYNVINKLINVVFKVKNAFELNENSIKTETLDSFSKNRIEVSHTKHTKVTSFYLFSSLITP